MHVSKAVSLCRRLLAQADLGGEANVLPPLAELEAMRGRFGETRRLVANARAAYDQLGQHALAETNCGAVEGRIELLAGENGAAEQSFRASCEALERIGGLAYLSTRAAELGDVLYELGRYDEAERWARRSQELGAPDDVLTQLLSQSVLARLSARKGELREADELSLEAIALSETTDALNRRGKALLDRAEVLRLADRCDEAGTTVERAIELFEQKGNAAASQRARATLAELSVA
jgi:tetratricopeptide (TPR) repeat protein